MPSVDNANKNVVVLGAGVIGLSTAVMIQENGGYDVTIVAENLPTDPRTINYCSAWAGGHHVSFANGDPRIQKIDSATFDTMWKMSEPGADAEHCFLRIHETQFFYDARDGHYQWYPEYAALPQDALTSVPGAKTGCTFRTLTFDAPKYVNYLLGRFLSRGGSIVRGKVGHVNQIIEGGAELFTRGQTSTRPVDAVVVCAGLGARTLGGLEDKDVYPVRGQVLLLKAPWVRSGRTASHNEDGLWTYVIPRRNGEIIIGGTKLENDWYPAGRPETTEDILQRCLALCPELAPPEVRAQRTPTIEDLRSLILEVGVGLRPARKGGIRLEVEWADIPCTQGKVPLIFNYGHSGSGFQSSWGSADEALRLLQAALGAN